MAASADESAAMARVKAMSDYIAAHKMISFSFDTDREIVTKDKRKLAQASSGRVTLNRPALRVRSPRSAWPGSRNVRRDAATRAFMTAEPAASR
jgi:hypothetical protein